MHLDLDAFFAAVVMRDNPELEDVPLIIGPNPRKGQMRGVVLTSNYPARKFGIKSGMPISKAYALCPEAVFMHSPMDQIEKSSKQVMAIVKVQSGTFQSGGLDEAYFTLKDPPTDWGGVQSHIEKLQSEIWDTCHLSCSIGASTTRSLAKIASDLHKPRGIMVITPTNREKVLAPLELRRISGVGKKTYAYISQKGYNLFQDVFSKSMSHVDHDLGRIGRYIWRVAQGLTSNKIGDWGNRKSIGKERTFLTDEEDPQILEEKLLTIGDALQQSVLRKGLQYATVTLKIRFASFKTYTKAFTFPTALQDPAVGFQKMLQMFREYLPLPEKVRLLGLRYSHFSWGKPTRQDCLEKWLAPV